MEERETAGFFLVLHLAGKSLLFFPVASFFADQNRKIEILVALSRQGKMKRSVSTRRVINHLEKKRL